MIVTGLPLSRRAVFVQSMTEEKRDGSKAVCSSERKCKAVGSDMSEQGKSDGWMVSEASDTIRG